MSDYCKQCLRYEKCDNSNCCEKAYAQGKAEGRAEAIDEYRNKLSKEMHDLWRFYKADTKNRPKPTFICANSMVDLIAEQLKEQGK